MVLRTPCVKRTRTTPLLSQLHQSPLPLAPGIFVGHSISVTVLTSPHSLVRLLFLCSSHSLINTSTQQMQKQTLSLTLPPPPTYSTAVFTFSFIPPATLAKRSTVLTPLFLLEYTYSLSTNLLGSSKYTSNLIAFYHHHYYPYTKPPSSLA